MHDCNPRSILAEFDHQHTKEHPRIASGGYVYFSTGAIREVNPLGALIDPPTELHKLAENQFHYWDIRLQDVRDKFNAYRQPLLTAAREGMNSDSLSFPPSPDEVIPKLKEMQAEVQRIKAHWDDAKEFKEENPDPRVVTRQRNREMARKQNQALFSAIQGIKI